MTEALAIFPPEVWQPLAWLGITNPLLALNKEIIINTWCALGILLVFSLVGRWALSQKNSVARYTVTTILRSFMGLVTQSLSGALYAPYFYYISTLFLYLVVCNTLILIPGLEEPTSDLNTTIAMGLIAVFYAQKEGIRAHGIVGYLNEYFKTPLTLFPNGFSWRAIPFAIVKAIGNIVIGSFTFPMELMGKLSNIISLSLRLFGNILGGSSIARISKYVVSGSWLWQTVTLITGLNLVIALFFGLFEGFIQAFVFSILAITYISMTAQTGEEHKHA
ncbi:MAG: F0F1 ATP synthase subunit A [Candidatus Babeliaceae bacterium]|nr:F0F1 ATP synthase subunit A [Candidatus Babeliaceae bacterium]